jgi:hypothetical protein
MAIEGDENEDEDKVLGSNTQWNDNGVDTLIALRGEMELEFVKNGKKNKVFYIALPMSPPPQLGSLI